MDYKQFMLIASLLVNVDLYGSESDTDDQLWRQISPENKEKYALAWINSASPRILRSSWAIQQLINIECVRRLQETDFKLWPELLQQEAGQTALNSLIDEHIETRIRNGQLVPRE